MPVCISLQLYSHRFYTNAGGDNHVETFVSKVCFGLADISQRGLEENMAIGRMVEASGAIIPVKHGIYFWDLRRLK
jgi:hypothetical protein